MRRRAEMVEFINGSREQIVELMPKISTMTTDQAERFADSFKTKARS